MALPVISSHLEDDFNDALEQRLGRPIQRLPWGSLDIPDNTEILLASPIGKGGQGRTLPQPANWPKHIKWIQLVSSGIDLFPAWFLRSARISTARGVAAHSIAEYCLAAMLSVSKDLPNLWVSGPEQWTGRRTASVYGSTIGLLGLGAIGQALAHKALGLGAQVVALRQSKAPAPLAGVRLVGSVGELMALSDHLVLVAPSTPSTYRIIDAAAWACAKPGLHLVNVARGELVDDEALLAALASGQAGFATLDTTAPEPLPAGHPFYSHGQIKLSPHTSALSWLTRKQLVDKFITNLARYESGQALLDELP
ncbi:NAD(P)-dependent oxidoreductase [Pseudomonas typographi]|uniref:NAD(P)-dependent oxidoreductase n=1 Tax=Pseudomonas typographi TaxID=2715964 RepID=UPI00168540E4|nr:NAD(P)-dependent oxidoreductase [Pseudomonas typographi]MBD1552056.1 dihydrofolate reductase [Pseudomonas typographi]MBD1586620.1 dihydrofolate reductase [Pseudomonas typographi]